MKHIIYNIKNARRRENVFRIALSLLKQGGLLVFPSDTVYGLMADASNEKAVRKLISFKNRPPGKAISIFAADYRMLKENADIDAHKLSVIKKILPGPFTVILKSRHRVSRLLESEYGTLGLRIPMDENIVDLVKKFGRPLTATSANLSGQSPHYSVDSFLRSLSKSKKKLIDLIIDAGKLPRNKPSTVIDLTKPKLKIFRQGDIVLSRRKTFISNSPGQTKKIAIFILKKFLAGKWAGPLIFIIKGDFGAGKTIFIKGIGENLGIRNIVSPSFTVAYEYLLDHPYFKNLAHYDLYNIDDPEEFRYLGIGRYLNKGNIICFEWGDKAGEIYENLKKSGTIVYININYIDKKTREIIVNS